MCENIEIDFDRTSIERLVHLVNYKMSSFGVDIAKDGIILEEIDCLEDIADKIGSTLLDNFDSPFDIFTIFEEHNIDECSLNFMKLEGVTDDVIKSIGDTIVNSVLIDAIRCMSDK